MKSMASLLKAIVFAILILPATGMAADTLPSAAEAETMAIADLEEARQILEALAVDGGLDGESLLALGIVQFRIGDIDSAKVTLRSLAHTSFEYQAKYFLGLISEAGGDYERAREFYSAAANQYEDLAVQERADHALLVLSFDDRTDAPGKVVNRRNLWFISGNVKSVDGLVDPDDSVALDESDTAFDLLAAGSLTLWSPDDRNSWRIGANVFSERHSDFSEYDLQVLGGWTQYEHSFGRNLLQLQFGLSDIRFGGEDYLGYTDFVLANTIALTPVWDLKASALYREISANNPDYAFYAGDAMQLGLELRGKSDTWWRFEYRYRREDLADRYLEFTNDEGAVFDGFQSYSRDYHQLAARYDLTWSDRLTQTFSALLRSTEYADANLFLESGDDPALTEATRDGWRWSFGSELTWSVSERMNLLFEIEYLDEDANIDLYDFDSLRIGVGADYLF